MKKAFTAVTVALLLLIIAMQEPLITANSLSVEPAPSGLTLTATTAFAPEDHIQANGKTYTLTGNISTTLIIGEDNIVIDGAGYFLNGDGSETGIFIQEKNNVTIKNLAITNFQNGIKTVSPVWSNVKKHDIFTGNTFINNSCGINIDDYLDGSEISNNTFYGNSYAVSYARNVIFRNNQFENNLYTISGYINDADESNLVNQKPMIYWVNQKDKVVPLDAGWVMLVNCQNITVEGLNLDFKGSALSLQETINTTIKGNRVANCAEGIYLWGASQIQILNNVVEMTGEYGIKLEYSNNNTLRGNLISNTKVGIDISVSSANTITNNKIVNNAETAITLTYTGSSNFRGSLGPNIMSQNIISSNGVGIFVNSGTDEVITYNNITDNLGWGIQLRSAQQNVIHHNNFINNNVTDKLQVAIGGYFVDNRATTGKIDFVAGKTDFWDNNGEGNYWSDYESLHPNATKNGAIWSAGFYINENNMDHYPLTEPVTIETFNSEALPQPTSTEKATQEPIQDIAIALTIIIVVLVMVGLVVYVKGKNRR